MWTWLGTPIDLIKVLVQNSIVSELASPKNFHFSVRGGSSSRLLPGIQIITDWCALRGLANTVHLVLSGLRHEEEHMPSFTLTADGQTFDLTQFSAKDIAPIANDLAF